MIEQSIFPHFYVSKQYLYLVLEIFQKVLWVSNKCFLLRTSCVAQLWSVHVFFNDDNKKLIFFFIFFCDVCRAKVLSFIYFNSFAVQRRADWTRFYYPWAKQRPTMHRVRALVSLRILAGFLLLPRSLIRTGARSHPRHRFIDARSGLASLFLRDWKFMPRTLDLFFFHLNFAETRARARPTNGPVRRTRETKKKKKMFS